MLSGAHHKQIQPTMVREPAETFDLGNQALLLFPVLLGLYRHRRQRLWHFTPSTQTIALKNTVLPRLVPQYRLDVIPLLLIR